MLLFQNMFVVSFLPCVGDGLVQPRVILLKFFCENIVILSQVFQSNFQLAVLEEQGSDRCGHQLSDQRLQN